MVAISGDGKALGEAMMNGNDEVKEVSMWTWVRDKTGRTTHAICVPLGGYKFWKVVMFTMFRLGILGKSYWTEVEESGPKLEGCPAPPYTKLGGGFFSEIIRGLHRRVGKHGY